MSQQFDAYQRWLGIPPEQQPPTYYRLLDIAKFEADPQTIAAAAESIMDRLHDLSTGEHIDETQRLLNEVASARRCLLDESKRAAYDHQLRAPDPKEAVVEPEARPEEPSPRVVVPPPVEMPHAAAKPAEQKPRHVVPYTPPSPQLDGPARGSSAQDRGMASHHDGHQRKSKLSLVLACAGFAMAVVCVIIFSIAGSSPKDALNSQEPDQNSLAVKEVDRQPRDSTNEQESDVGKNPFIETNEDVDDPAIPIPQEFAGGTPAQSPEKAVAEPKADGLIARWTMDNTDAQIVRDETGNWACQIVGNPTSETGISGSAIRFNGATDFVSVPSFRLDAKAATITAWVNGTRTINWTGIVYGAADRKQGIGYTRFKPTVGYHWAAVSHKWDSRLSIPADQWTFLALSVEPQQATVFLWTESGGLKTATHAGDHPPAEFRNLEIGRESAATGRYFKGMIDEVRIYNRALVQNEIEQLIATPNLELLKDQPVLAKGDEPPAVETPDDAPAVDKNDDPPVVAKNDDPPPPATPDVSNTKPDADHATWELKSVDILNATGDGPDGKPNTADDTWQFWFQDLSARNFFRLNAFQKNTILHGWTGNKGLNKAVEGVWANAVSDEVFVHPYAQSNKHRGMAVSFRIPATGLYNVFGGLTDAEFVPKPPHDGILWRLERARGAKRGQPLKEGAIGDRRGHNSGKFAARRIKLEEGDLLRLLIHPAAFSGKDLTRIDYFRIEQIVAKPPSNPAALPANAVASSKRESITLKAADIVLRGGDGADSLGNTADDTWQFWYEEVVNRDFHRLNSYYDNKRFEGWSLDHDMDTKYEGVWANQKTGAIFIHPYVEKSDHRGMALSCRVKTAGVYRIRGALTDVEVDSDAPKHDGISWRVDVARAGEIGRKVGNGGPIGDGHGRPDSATFAIDSVTLKAGDMVRLVILPNKWWGRDLTRIDEFTIEFVGKK
jgi:hypothetical protein